jgi:phosphonate transport system substrate-binding protein
MIRHRPLLTALVLFSAAVCLRSDEKPLIYATMPDGMSQSERQPLVDYLTLRLGRNVKLVTPESYNLVMAGLARGDIDFACIGGVTYVRARARSGVVPLVQRTMDVQFHSVFITGAKSGIQKLSDLVGKKFAYGDAHSTSGHVIPYLEIKRAGLNPNTDFSFRYSGSHPLTMKLVETGIVDAGAVDESVLTYMINSKKIDGNRIRVFYRSKPFVDNVWVARSDVPTALQMKFAKAFLDLNQSKDGRVLSALHATKFVSADDAEYRALRRAVHELKLD